MTEHSERSRYITDMVALYISNEGTYDGPERIAERAATLAADDDHTALATYVTHIIRTHPEAREVRAEMAGNDYDRIHWADVAAELTA